LQFGIELLVAMMLQGEDVNALVNQGIQEARQQHYVQAEAYYERALRVLPDNPDIQLNLALAHFKSTDLNGAIPIFQKVLKQRPDNPQARTLLGMCYYGTRDFSKALLLLEQAPEAQTSIELRQMLAEAYIWTGQMDKAGNVIAGLLRDSPDSANAHMLLAQAYDGQGKADEAIREFQAAAQAKDSEPNVHFGLGYLYWRDKKYDDAQREFERELSFDPANALALAYWGDIEFKREHAGHAQELLDKSIALQADVRIAHFDLGVLLQQQQKHPDAIREFRRAIELEPKRPDAHYRLAASLRAMGRKAEAENELKAVRDLNADKTEDTIYKITGPVSAH
jgi:tetratricopeptide (TPR) repeat protein